MPPDTLVILTGASRGLGQAMAARYLGDGAFVLGLSRQQSATLAAAGGARIEQWPADLAQPMPVVERLAAWLAAYERRGPVPKRVRLIHNAASISEPGDVGEVDAGAEAQRLRIGLEAPVALTAVFLRATGHWATSDRRVLFVSSGLGRRPLAGSAAYCAQKAGLDHFARALALEEGARANGARVAAVAPGIVDTDMQRQLRGADPAKFAQQPMFNEWHASGALDSPAGAAAKVIALLERADYGANPVTDVRA
ncbi:MAG: SDR family NAD(P)-dependent oxidoreductase [Betaproteobacteria bacterium]